MRVGRMPGSSRQTASAKLRPFSSRCKLNSSQSSSDGSAPSQFPIDHTHEGHAVVQIGIHSRSDTLKFRTCQPSSLAASTAHCEHQSSSVRPGCLPLVGQAGKGHCPSSPEITGIGKSYRQPLFAVQVPRAVWKTFCRSMRGLLVSPSHSEREKL